MHGINSQHLLHHENYNHESPPEHTLPIIEKIRLLHANIYTIGNKLPKQHKLGIHSTVEELVRKIMELFVEARFKATDDKLEVLEIARVKNEVLKHALRTEHELNIINEKEYIRLVEQVVEISRMLSGWIKYITEKSQIR